VAGSNLVANGSFESALSGWSNWGNATTVTGQSSSGLYAVRVGSAGGGLGANIPGITAGTVYRLSGQVKVSAGSEIAYLGVRFMNAAGSNLLEQSVPFSTMAYYGAKLDVRAPANATAALVYVWKNSGSGFAYLDEIALAPMSGFGPTKGAFIGNSITYSFPTASMGWDHASGMSASSADTDYAHLAAAALNIGAPAITNFAALEREPAANKAGIPAVTAGIDAATAVTIALGDNARLERLTEFGDAYNALLDAVRQARSLVCVSTWWEAAAKDAIIKSACEAHGGTYVYIGDIRTDPQNQDQVQGPQYADGSVDDHPHDWSMARIAARVAAATPR